MRLAEHKFPALKPWAPVYLGVSCMCSYDQFMIRSVPSNVPAI